MNLRDLLLGKRAPQQTTTAAPEEQSNFEILSKQRRHVGRSVSDLFSVLRAEPREAQRVCSYGHLVPDGNTVCSHGHWVG